MNIIGICGQARSGKDTSANFLVAERNFVIISLADEMKRICMRVYGWTEEQLWGESDLRNVPDFRYLKDGRIPAWNRDEFCHDVGIDIGASTDKLLAGYKIMNRQTQEAAERGWLTPRFALQKLGTEWARECYENTWVDILIRNAEDVLYDGTYGHPYSRTKGVGDYKVDAPRGVVVADVRYPNEAKAIQAAGGIVIKLNRPGAGLQGDAALHTSETSIDAVEEDVLIDNDGTLDELKAKILEVANEQA